MTTNSGFTALSVYDEKPQEKGLHITVYIDDKKLDSKYGLVSVWIRKEVNKIGKAELNFKAWSKIEQDEDSDSENKVFTPGNSIRIEAKDQNDTAEQPIFEGMIIAHHLEMGHQEDSFLKIECRDYMYPSTIGYKSEILEDKTDAKIIDDIIKKYPPLKGTVGDTGKKADTAGRAMASDWDFLLQCAQTNKLSVITEGKQISIKEPDMSASPVFKFIFGDNIISIKGKIQSSRQLSKVEIRAWNSKEQKPVSIVVDKVKENDQGDVSSAEFAKKMGNNELVLHTSKYTDEASLKKWAEQELLEKRLARIRGDIVCRGTAKIKVGDTVELEKFGKHFNGKAFCGAIEHEIKDGNWLTTVCMGHAYESKDENAQNAMNKSNQTGQTASIKGLQIGKVLKIDQDPSKEYQIQVEIPLLQSKKSNKVWARLATFWASNKYGAFFIPDIGDEVVLGFFDNDLGQPVILGSMYSGKQAPINAPDKKNNIRSITTKSKLTLEFEEEKKIITLKTPGKNIIEISDDGKSIKLTDQSKNKIEMTNNGIVIESAKGISLKAKTDIKAEAGTNVDIKGKSAVNLKGANIEAKADAAFTAKGSAKAEISAGGQTVVKGAMVMIN